MNHSLFLLSQTQYRESIISSLAMLSIIKYYLIAVLPVKVAATCTVLVCHNLVQGTGGGTVVN